MATAIDLGRAEKNANFLVVSNVSGSAAMGALVKAIQRAGVCDAGVWTHVILHTFDTRHSLKSLFG